MLKEILEKYDQKFGLYKDPDGVSKLVKQFIAQEITALLEGLKLKKYHPKEDDLSWNAAATELEERINKII